MKIPGKYNIKLRQLLDYVSQEEIFESLIKIYPEEGEKYFSPFRVDKTPDCYFKMDRNGVIRFYDWANPDYPSLDCFDAVKVYYNLDSYLQVIHLIYDTLIENRNISTTSKKQSSFSQPPGLPSTTQIQVCTTEFSKKDYLYWMEYGITEEHLKEDRVYPISKYFVSNKKGQDVYYCESKLAYSDTSFPSGHKKIYFPKSPKFRFLTNCTHNDIGNISNLNPSLEYLLITKSHKDHRVLKNLGYVNTVYFSNEGQIPEDSYLSALVFPYTRVYIFFDSDSTGIKASRKLKDAILDIYENLEIIIIFLEVENCKDISDLYKASGKECCLEFLQGKIKLTKT